VKRLFICVIVLFFFTSCLPPNEGKIVDISTVDFSNIIEKKEGIILDVRTIDEINNGHIENASFIDFYDKKFREKAAWINKDLPVYVYCQAGGRSKQAAKILIDLGQKEVYNITGGYSEWNQNGFKVIDQGKELSFKSKTYSSDEIESVINKNENVLLVFKTPWCLPCKKLIPVLEEFKQQNKETFVLQLDMDANSEIAKLYGVTSIPTILYFENNTLSKKYTGYISVYDLTALIK
tara:strand:+ start:89 stop:796 length:708 start_codon:yes stop_codon:yes gene_type:complete